MHTCTKKVKASVLYQSMILIIDLVHLNSSERKKISTTIPTSEVPIQFITLNTTLRPNFAGTEEAAAVMLKKNCNYMTRGWKNSGEKRADVWQQHHTFAASSHVQHTERSSYIM